MNTGEQQQQPVERPVTIRFSHVDAAGIVFYPRYFEILSEVFPEISVATPATAFGTEFHASNRLGDELDILCDPFGSDGSWSFCGRMQGTDHFSIRALPAEASLDRHAHEPQKPSFRTVSVSLAAWATDYTGCLQISRFFELVNLAVEQWFADKLGMSFREMHLVRGMGIPTVQMTTWCRDLPKIGESVTMWIRPTRIGRRSLVYTTWLVRGDECLIGNEQVVVFIKNSSEGFETIAIPEDIRARLDAQLAEAGRGQR